MKRSDLAILIRARVEHLVDDLVETIATRAEQQIVEALEVARSALESGLAQTGRPSGLDAAPAPSPDDESSRRADKDPATVYPPSRSRAPSSGTSSSRRAAGERTNTCSSCGAVGFTARTCGKTHNVPSVPAGGSRADAAEAVGPSEASPRRQSRPPAPAELDDDEIDDTDEKTQSPPPCYARREQARPLRRHRGVRCHSPRRASGAADHLRSVGATA